MRIILTFLMLCSVAHGQRLWVSSYRVSPSATTAYNPANDASVVEWLKGDAITGATPGSTFTPWQASKGNNAVQTFAGNRPVYLASFKNSLPVVAFTNAGSVATMATTTFGTLTPPYAIAMVFKGTSSASTTEYLDGLSSANRVLIGVNNATTKFFGSGGTSVDLSAFDVNWHTLYILVNGASSQWAIDGGAPNTVNFGSGSFVGLTLGSKFDGSTISRVYIGEAIVWNSTPTASLSSIFAYLGRWGTMGVP